MAINSSAVADGNREDQGIESSDAEAIEGERRRLRRWFWGLGVLTALGIFGLLRYDYPTLTTASGRTYEVNFTRYRGTDGRWTQLKYFTHSRSIDGKLSEVKELFPYAAGAANSSNDSVIRIISTRRRFGFGLFVLDQNTIFQFERVGDQWRMP
jgi:hypothetical protein